jgi:hypothetical protein
MNCAACTRLRPRGQSQCMDLAAKVKYPELRATFVELADKWTLLATKLERVRKQ